MKNYSYYKENYEQAMQNATRLKKRTRFIAICRFILFVLFGIFCFFSFNAQIFWLIPAFICIAAFIYLMRSHALAEDEHTFYSHLADINASELAVVSEGKPFSTCTGNVYYSDAHPYAADLDLFGEASLFQYINRTETLMGEEALATALLNPLLKQSLIIQRQEAIKELSLKHQFRQHFQARARMAGNHAERIRQLQDWLSEQPVFLPKKFICPLLWLVPLLALSGFIIAFITGQLSLLIIAVLINWLIAGLYLKKVNRIHVLVGKNKDLLSTYSKLNTMVCRQQFSSAELLSLQQRHKETDIALQKLSKLAATFDQRLNTMLGPVFNSLFLFDMQCVWRIETWKKQYAAQTLDWIDALGNMEMLITLGTFAFNHKDYVYPELAEETAVFDAEAMAHPLIRSKPGVTNTFSFNSDNKVFIITGSNMSGKSTFLRTIGVSVLTGMMGLPVNAKRMRFSPVWLMSSMRIADSLSDQTSYFYAELKRLKILSDAIELSDIPALLLIDEMLKGTNSKEKLEGSVMIIEKLITKPCVAFIATHDLALGVLEQRFPDKVSNYSFESEIINNELVFDYKIRKGVASSTNATFLLKKMQIV